MPLCIVVLVDIAETTYHEWKGSELSARTSDALRVACWTLSVINAVFVYESLQYVTALIGINSVSLEYTQSTHTPHLCTLLLTPSSRLTSADAHLDPAADTLLLHAA